MGVRLGLQTISDETHAKVLADPPLIWKVIAPDDPEVYAEACEECGSEPSSEPFPTEEGAYVSLDKAWHGIHYLLTASESVGNPPLDFLLIGGTDVEVIDVGYGPPRLFTSREVRAIQDALNPIDAATLRKRFNPTEMMDLQIYPTIWDRDPADDDTLGYCVRHFEILKKFVSDAVTKQQGFVVTLS